MATSLTSKTNSLIIVDSRVTDWQKVIGDVNSDTIVLILDSAQDGLTQIANVVANYSGLDAIHIISHGSAGSLLLGSGTVDANSLNLSSYQANLSAIGNALSETGDILLYGCDVAAGTEGQAFIAQLSTLTGADVAASIDPTGSALFGGNSVLEANAGAIEASTLDFSNYDAVLAVPALPVAVTETLTAAEDLVANYTASQLLANDKNSDGVVNTNLVINAVQNLSPTLGNVVLNGDNSITFTPVKADYNGAFYFRYQVKDTVTNLISNWVTEKINIQAVNDAPVANFDKNNDTVYGVEDESIIIDVNSELLLNDKDVDGDTFSISSITNVKDGTVTRNGDTITFTPRANFSGTASFDYQLTDGFLTSNTVTVNVEVFAINDAPVANFDSVFDSVSAVEDVQTTFYVSDLLINDSDADSDPLTITSVTAVKGGTVQLVVPDPLNHGLDYVVFKSDPDYNSVAKGDASFTYVVSDGKESSSATVAVRVDPVNDAPTANPDTLTATEDTSITYTFDQLIGNDKDVDGNAIQIVNVASKTNGTAYLTATGVVFKAAKDFNVNSGDATFDYTITDGLLTSTATATVQVAAVNDAPIAVNNALSFPVGTGPIEDTTFTFSAAQLVSNDIDVDGPSKKIASVTNGTGGTVSLLASGDVKFTPNPDFNGAADFSYVLTDADPTNPLSSNSAKVSFNVEAVNDAPVAGKHNVTAREDIPTTYSSTALLGNDFDADKDTLSITSVSPIDGGTVSLDVTKTVITFTSNPDFNGKAHFSYDISDGNGGSTTAVVEVDVTPVNDAPVALGELLIATEDTAIIYKDQLLANDKDVDTDHALLKIANLSNFHGGNAVLNVDGSVTFTPTPNYNGPASFDYQVFDGGAYSSTVTASIDVKAANDFPVAVNDKTTALENSSLTFLATSLLANDYDPDTGTNVGLKIFDVFNGVNGKVSLNVSGDVVFTPDNPDFHGKASFDYVVQDVDLGVSNTATVSIDISNVNDAPVAKADTLDGVNAATEDTTKVYGADVFLLNDNDIDGDKFFISQVINVAKGGGTAVKNASGGITFTPDPDFFGDATFQYVINDGQADSAPTTVTVKVNNVNDAPVAITETLTANEGQTITFDADDLLKNDQDADHDTLKIASVSNGKGGTVQLDASGNVVFTPNAYFNGAADFSYTASDGSLESKAVSVTVNVGLVASLPIAKDDNSFTVSEDATTVTFLASDILKNDFDPDGGVLTIAVGSVVSPLNSGGKAVLNAAGNIEFTPDKDFNGNAQFTYQAQNATGVSNPATVTVKVNPVNDAPFANDNAVSVAEDTIITYSATDLLANDTDIDSDHALLKIASVQNGSNGTVTLSADKTVVTFIPNPNFTGTADFKYFVTDGTDVSALPATVKVTVTPVNDAPVAYNDTVNGATEDTPVNISGSAIWGNDKDADIGDTFHISSVADGHNGKAVLNPDGSVTFTPNANFTGTADFTYKVADTSGAVSANSGTVNVVVDAINDAPVAVNDTLSFAAPNPIPTEDVNFIFTRATLLGNDYDIDNPNSALSIKSVASGDGGIVTIAGNDVLFTPTPDFNGDAYFTYVLTDGALDSSPAKVSFKVAPTNDAPTAKNDTVSATEDTAINYKADVLLGNDTDIDKDVIKISSIDTTGTTGKVTLNTDGSVTFTPNKDFDGTTSFAYQITDGITVSNSATVTINMKAVNDAPVAVNDELTIAEETNVTFSVGNPNPLLDLTSNDKDVDSLPANLSVVSVVSGKGGIATLNPDGTVSFVPETNFNGDATFTYQIKDDAANISNTATVTIHVTGVNDVPIAYNDTVGAVEDTQSIFDANVLLGNDTDFDVIDQGKLVIDSVTSGAHGTAVLGVGGATVVFTPEPNFVGDADFTYTVKDLANATSNAATVTVRVSAVNDAPIAYDDTAKTNEDTVITFAATTLLANDKDTETPTAALKIVSVSDGNNGKVVFDSVTNVVTFTPNPDFNGTADFTYKATDGILSSNSAKVTVTVDAVNDVPIANVDDVKATEDTVITYTASSLISNDKDVDDALASLVIDHVTNGVGGKVALNGSGDVVFTPDANFNSVANGLAYFTYATIDPALGVSNEAKVTVNIDAINDAPIANNDDTLTATEDVIATYTATQLMANDTDQENNPFQIVSVGNATHGKVTLNADKTITFAPDQDFNGDATFTYVINDGLLDSAPATVKIKVNAVNDAPVAKDDPLTAITEDTAFTYAKAVLIDSNDTDVDNAIWELSVASVADVKDGGGHAVLNADGTVTFTPDANFAGNASFTYQTKDPSGALSNVAKATLLVNNVNDAPVANNDTLDATEDTSVTYTASALLGNDTDFDKGDYATLVIGSVTSGANGTATLNGDGTVTFKANTDVNGPVTFTYQAKDTTGALSNTATVTVNVKAVNDAPVAYADAVTAVEDTATTFTSTTLLGNDIDVDGPSKKIASVTSGTNGIATLNANGDVVFTPIPNFTGTATFSYVATDTLLQSNSTTVTVTVTGTNDAPVLAAPSMLTYTDTPFFDNFNTLQKSGTLTATDSDVPTVFTYGIAGGTVSGGIATASNAYGTLTVNTSTGFYTFTPDGAKIEPLTAYAKDSTLTVTVSDGTLTDSKAFTVEIKQSGVTESVNNDSLTGTTGADIWAGLAGNDTYIIDNTGDVVIEDANNGIDTISSSVSYVLPNNVEYLTLTGSAVSGTGNALDNKITGNSANNSLDGGLGIDTLEGGGGDDSYYVNDAKDQVTESGASSKDMVYSTVSYTLSNFVYGLTLDGSGNINATGNILNNLLVGNSGNNILDGAGGLSDTLQGAGGDDTYYVYYNTTIVKESNGLVEGNDTIETTVNNYILADNVESLVLKGAYVFTAYGNTSDNKITGNANNNTLDGRGGADNMIGGLGDDTYYVDNVSDVVTENAGEGLDVIVTSIDYALAPNVESVILTGSATNATGNALGNSLFGGDANNTLTAGDGGDLVAGGKGQDTINLAETIPTTDVVRIGAGESLATISGHDIVNGFVLGVGGTTTGVDALDLPSAVIALNVASVDGVNYGTIYSHHIVNGLITFDSADTYASALTIDNSNLSNVLSYLQTNIAAGSTVVFTTAGNSSYVFQGGSVNDIAVELVGVQATGLSNTGLDAGAVAFYSTGSSPI